MIDAWFEGCHDFGSFGTTAGIIGLIISVALIAGLALLVIWMVRRVAALNRGFAAVEISELSPREILQARYVRGEITRDQYQQMLTDLG